MNDYTTKQIKNVVLLGSSGAGKTTFAEAMAYEGKEIDRLGTVEEGTTVSDFSDKEKEYRHSIYPSVLLTEFNGMKLNVIDAPGADDFCGGLFSAFKVVDVGLMVINAEEGFEAGTEVQARYARRHSKPIIVFINKLDSKYADWDMTVESLNSLSHVKPVIVQYPLNSGEGFDTIIDVLLMKCYRYEEGGVRVEIPIPEEEKERLKKYQNALVEAAAENDDSLMELYFDKGTLTEEEMRQGLKAGLSKRTLIPVFCGSAQKLMGIKRLMEFTTRVAPCPLKAPYFNTQSGDKIEPKSDGATILFVYKSTVEQHIGEITYFRVVSGTVKEGMELVNNSNNSNKVKISQLFVTMGKNRIKVNSLSAGDLGCTVKLKGVKTNDTLAHGSDEKITLIGFPKPRFQTAIVAQNKANDEKLGEALLRVTFEDPSVQVEYSKELKQIIISGQGEHHLNIVKSFIEYNYKMGVDFVAPKIPYRETISKLAVASYRHKKQSGGSGQFGEVSIVIMPHNEGEPDIKTFKHDGKEIKLNIRGREEFPLEWGGKLIFYNCIVGGVIDVRFMPAIVKGIMERMEDGPLTGSYARDIRVACFDGKMHPVDSNEISFKLATRHAFKEAFRNADPKIMEPIYSIEILTPSDKMGDVMSDLQNRRAIIEGMNSEKGFEQLLVKVPLSEMYRYSTVLSSLTSGRATFSMKFDSYSQMPVDVQQKLLKTYVDSDEE